MPKTAGSSFPPWICHWLGPKNNADLAIRLTTDFTSEKAQMTVYNVNLECLHWISGASTLPLNMQLKNINTPNKIEPDYQQTHHFKPQYYIQINDILRETFLSINNIKPIDCPPTFPSWHTITSLKSTLTDSNNFQKKHILTDKSPICSTK